MLKELYHGDIALSEHRADPNNSTLQEWWKLSAENEVLYIQGFKDEGLMMMEILGE